MDPEVSKNCKLYFKSFIVGQAVGIILMGWAERCRGHCIVMRYFTEKIYKCDIQNCLVIVSRRGVQFIIACHYLSELAAAPFPTWSCWAPQTAPRQTSWAWRSYWGRTRPLSPSPPPRQAGSSSSCRTHTGSRAPGAGRLKKQVWCKLWQFMSVFLENGIE